MRYLWLLALMGCGGVSLITIRKSPLPTKAMHCGQERWPIKVLTDPQAGQVNFTAHSATIAQLRALPAPKVLGTSRIAPTEKTVYTVHATIIAWKEENDLDLHLELQDHGLTMIAEVPDTACVVKSRVRSQITAVRAAVIRALGKPNSLRFVRVNKAATITGVGFWDFLHGQRGVSPNGIELHPVTQIIFTP